MSTCPKRWILVVVMCAHAVSDLQINFNISDFNSTTPLPEDFDYEESGSSNEPIEVFYQSTSGGGDYEEVHIVTGKGFGYNPPPPPLLVEHVPAIVLPEADVGEKGSSDNSSPSRPEIDPLPSISIISAIDSLGFGYNKKPLPVDHVPSIVPPEADVGEKGSSDSSRPSRPEIHIHEQPIPKTADGLQGFVYNQQYTMTRSQVSFSGFPKLDGNLSEKQKKSPPNILIAQLSSCNDSAPSDTFVNPSKCNGSSLNVPSDMRADFTQDSWREISEEAELFLTGRLSTVLIPSFYTLVCIISVPFNICAVLVFVWRIRPKNPAVIYMLNLACADLLFAAVLPFKISYHFNANNWIFGSAMCRLVTAAFFWNMYCSVLLIACMSVDRFLGVVYPISSLSWRSPRKAVIACVTMWVLSFLGSLHILFTEQTVHLIQLNITTCHDIQPSQLFELYKLFYVILCFLLFFLPLVITAVSYIQVIKTLSKAQPGFPNNDRKKRRAVVLASTVLVMFVICFTPTNCVYIVHQLNFNEGDLVDHADNLYIVYLVFLCLGSLNCLLDPLVYYFGSSQFQKELSSMLGRQKTTRGTGSGQPSSDPSTSTSRTALKSNRKEGSENNTNRDSPEVPVDVRPLE